VRKKLSFFLCRRHRIFVRVLPAGSHAPQGKNDKAPFVLVDAGGVPPPSISMMAREY
jgi:hypothetical protein